LLSLSFSHSATFVLKRTLVLVYILILTLKLTPKFTITLIISLSCSCVALTALLSPHNPGIFMAHFPDWNNQQYAAFQKYQASRAMPASFGAADSPKSGKPHAMQVCACVCMCVRSLMDPAGLVFACEWISFLSYTQQNEATPQLVFACYAQQESRHRRVAHTITCLSHRILFSRCHCILI